MDLTQRDLEWARKTIQCTEFFKDCSAAEWEILMDELEKLSFKAGSTIIFQGEISNKLYLVQSGKVSVTIAKKKRKEKIAEIGPNCFFGEISLLTPKAATATVKAEEDSEIVILEGGVVRKIIQTNPALEENINNKIKQRLDEQCKCFEDDKHGPNT
ncbi:cyclic nucleotide-binding domain-containing protein [Elusimicrobiota bacterium]